MAIQRISKEHNNLICGLFEKVKGSIKIVSPFITRGMGDILAARKNQSPDLEAKVITRFYREDFIQRVSEVNALKKLNDCGVKIYVLQDLHAKLYLFDDNTALIGSANFTSGGFKSNHELSLHITDEPDVNDSLVDYFDELLEAILSQSYEYLLTSDKIASEQAAVELDIKKRHISKEIKQTNAKRFGAKLPILEKSGNTDSELVESDSIQTILSPPPVKSENIYAQQEQSGKITAEMIRAAYEVAKMVYGGEISGTKGKNMLVGQVGMNKNSAADYINSYRKMREGSCYTRTMSSYGTEIYFEGIHRDFGDEALKKALKASRKHLEYYEKLTGSRNRKIAELIDRFTLKI